MGKKEQHPRDKAFAAHESTSFRSSQARGSIIRQFGHLVRAGYNWKSGERRPHPFVQLHCGRRVSMQTSLTRRNFVQGVAGVSTALATRGRILGANDRIQTAVIGLGTRGSYLLRMALHRAGEKNDVAVVALSDVYQARLSRAATKALDAKQYTHHQELLDRKDIDAVMIATPD